MRPTTWQLLRDGLRLALLLAPKTIRACHRVYPVLLLALLQTLATLPVLWLSAEAPRYFDPGGLGTLLTKLSLTLLAAAAIAHLTQARTLVLSIAAWLFASGIVQSLTGAVVVGVCPTEWVGFGYWAIAIAWTLMICLRIGFILAPTSARAIGAALAALLIAMTPWWIVDTPEFISTDWLAYYDSDWDETSELGQELAIPEHTMYAQPALLDAALAALAPQRPDHIDLYVVGFAGDADEGAFRNEVDFLPALASHRLDAAERTLRLVNHVGSADELPLATVTNLERSLGGIAERMDIDEDILFLYLTSHGSEDHLLYVNQPPLPLRQLGPQRLRAALDEAGIRWRVIVISACYSGGFLEALDDPNTLVITAASADRTSFGCGNSANATWFGQAFLIDGLNHTSSFRRAFLRAKRLIAEREEAEEHTPSEPQWQAGAAIGEHLTRWRKVLPEGEAVTFVPSVLVVSDDEGTPLPAEADLSHSPNSD